MTTMRDNNSLSFAFSNIILLYVSGPGPGYFRRRGNMQHPTAETTFTDMIEKFNKRRVEQKLVNNLLKQRRDTMYNLTADNNNKKSTSRIWNEIVEAKADILDLESETNADTFSDRDTNQDFDENINANLRSTMYRKPFGRPTFSKRKSRYEVNEGGLQIYDKPEETSVKVVQQVHNKPSYATDRENRIYKDIQDQHHHISRNTSHNKVRSRRAANIWGLVREKALGPDDLKHNTRQLQNQSKISKQYKDTNPVLLEELKTDDQKLFEKEKHTVSATAHGKKNTGKTNVSNSEPQLKDEKLPNGLLPHCDEKPIENLECSMNNNKGTTKTHSSKKSTEYHTSNGHIPNAKQNTSRFLQLPAKGKKTASPRPKSAKGRVRQAKRTTHKHTEDIQSTLETIATEMKNMIDTNSDDEQLPNHANNNQLPTRTIATSDDDASLSNYLYSDLSENEISKIHDRKLSCFDLDIDDNIIENQKQHITNLSETGDTNPDRTTKSSRKNSGDSRKSSITSRKTPTSSRKNSSTDDTIEKMRQEKINEELWDDVRRCRYLRGYDPPEMIMPNNVNVFVFGKDENDIIEEIRLEKLTQAEEEKEKDQDYI